MESALESRNQSDQIIGSEQAKSDNFFPENSDLKGHQTYIDGMFKYVYAIMGKSRSDLTIIMGGTWPNVLSRPALFVGVVRIRVLQFKRVKSISTADLNKYKNLSFKNSGKMII